MWLECMGGFVTSGIPHVVWATVSQTIMRSCELDGKEEFRVTVGCNCNSSRCVANVEVGAIGAPIKSLEVVLQ